jgi:rhamnosyltransferase
VEHRPATRADRELPMTNTNLRVVTIVVTYNSDVIRLKESLLVLVQQCTVVVVDNSTHGASRDWIRETCASIGVDMLPLGDNFGIAHAQNVGIAWARKRGASDILLMDDDSIAPPSLIPGLLAARSAALIQPVVISARTIAANGSDISNCPAKHPTGLTPCLELNSSGTLIPMSLFDLVGVFDAELFIDCVDFEWGWRALSMGVPLVLCDSVFLKHTLGECSRLGFRIPSPIRHYYQFRNVLRMIFGSNTPLRWRLSHVIKLPIKLILITILANHRIDRLRYAVWGLVDFITGRTGKFTH